MQKRLLAVATIVYACLLPSVSPAGDANHKPVEITILHLNDVYEIERPGDQCLGGLSRVAEIRRNLVEQNPRTLTVLSGDTLSPSPLGSAVIDGEELAGRQMVSILNTMGLDFATFGNHEFDLKKDQLRQRIRESAFTWVSSNVTDSFGQQLPGVPQEVVLRIVDDAKKEVRVGLIGLTIDSTQPEYVRFEDPIAVARDRVRKLRESCDVIIALTHLAIEQDRRLAAAIPQIHLILGGHEHEKHYECAATPERYSAPIVKGDSNAKTVAVHKLSFDTEIRRLSICTLFKRVTGAPDPDPLTGKAPDDVDSRTDHLAKFWKERCYRGLKEVLGLDPNQVVAQSDIVLDGLDTSVRVRSTNLTDLIGEAMKDKIPNARAAIYNCGAIRIDDLLGPGAIRAYDVLRILPYEGRVVGVELTGQLLTDLLNRGKSIPREGGFLQFVGIASGAQTGWEIGGEPIEPAKSYPVAMADFLLKGKENVYGDVRDPKSINGRLKQAWDKMQDADKKIKPGRTRDAPEIRLAVMDYMKRGNGHIQIAPNPDHTKRPVPANDVEQAIVEVDVDPIVNHTVAVRIKQ